MIAILLSLALAAAPLQDRAGAASVLHEADVRIVLEGTYAAVICSYLIERGGDSLVFDAERVPGQIVLVSGAFGPEGELESVHQVERRLLIDASRVTGPGVFRLRYNVEGDLSRIPLFVPAASSAADAALLITVVEADELDPTAMRPGFTLATDGTLQATVSELPAIVRLSAPDSAPGVPRLLLWAALLALVTVSLYFVGRSLIGRRARP